MLKLIHKVSLMQQRQSKREKDKAQAEVKAREAMEQMHLDMMIWMEVWTCWMILGNQEQILNLNCLRSIESLLVSFISNLRNLY